MNHARLETDHVSLRFDPSLVDLGRRLAPDYAAAPPFPHIVIDGLFPDEVLDAVVAEFPTTQGMTEHFDAAYEVKSANAVWSHMGAATRALFGELNLGTFIEFLEALTGIDGLVPDPFLVGGGQHQIEPGGRLGVHADFNVHKALHLDRRLNLLVYLNRDWQQAWGGELELWDAETKSCVERVVPAFNRCVVFNVSDVALHGHPDPLQCPSSTTRKSLALYYYTNGRPVAERAAEHTTIFHSRPDSDDPGKLRRIAADLTPPLVARKAKQLKAKIQSQRQHGRPDAEGKP